MHCLNIIYESIEYKRTPLPKHRVIEGADFISIDEISIR